MLNGARVFHALDGIPIRLGDVTCPVVAAVKELTRVEGFTTFVKRQGRFYLTLSEDIYDGLEKDEPGARFSLSHEIGHLVFHYDLLAKLSRIQHHDAALCRARSEHELELDTEFQADAFAGAFLMPAAGLQQLAKGAGLDAQRVAKKFGVSEPVAASRLRRVARAIATGEL